MPEIDFAEFEKFRGLVLRDIPLQEKLLDFTDRDKFADRVVELGAAHGFEFTIEEVTSAMRAGKRAWIERWI